MRFLHPVVLTCICLPLTTAALQADELKSDVQVDTQSGKAVLKKGSFVLGEEIVIPKAKAGARSGAANTSPGGKGAKKGVPANTQKQSASAKVDDSFKKKLSQQKLSNSFQQGLVLQSMGLDVQAIAYYEKALSEDPKYVSTYNNLAQCLIARNHEGDRQRAEQLLDKANKLSPSNVGGLYALAVLKERDKDYQGAQQLYSEVLKQEPFNMMAIQNLAEMHFRTGNKAAARAVIQQAISQNPPEQSAIILRQALSNLDKQSASGKNGGAEKASSDKQSIR